MMTFGEPGYRMASALWGVLVGWGPNPSVRAEALCRFSTGVRPTVY